jgi:Signal transduction histidine kinase
LWFVQSGGVSVIDPRRLPFNNLPPPVHIEKVSADDKDYEISNGMQLPAGVRNLAIDYTALSFVVPEKVHFRYKLEGQNRNWREVVNDREIQYTNLAPGTYRFRVLACNSSGVWNEQGASLEFVILPMWYQTNWFRALCAATFLALLWALYQLRLRQLARQFNMRLEERVGERTRIARDLHDTLLQSFHGVMLHFQTGINQLPERPGEAQKTLEKAMHQAKHAIVEGREAIQGLRSSVVETNDLAMAMRTLGEQLAADSNSTAFQVHMEGTSRDLHPILRDEVYRITGEGIRNAFRHADAKQIEVEIHYDDRRLRVRVRDDGKGIDPKLLSDDGREGHFGLRGMRERAKLIGGKLTVWSELDAGTELELSIPAARAYTTATDGQQMSLTETLLAKLSGRGTMKKP